MIVADVTAEFTARFGAAATGTVRWGWYITSTATTAYFSNVTAKLILTYEYDDTAHATRVKTVRIPIESLNGRLVTTGYTEIRQGAITNQIPALTGATPFLPENTPVVRQAFLELWSNTLPSGTTDGNVTLRLDAAGSTIAFTIDNTADSSVGIRLMWDITAENLALSHTLNGITTGANMMGFIGGWLTVTYEYNHTASSTILNSLFMGLGEDTENVLASADKSMVSVERYIEEPATVTLVQSAIWITYQSVSTSDTFTFKCGGQTATGYTPTADGAMCGMSSIVHRIDAGGYRGAALAFARGKNEFTAEWYTGTAARIGNVSCMTILNYTSGKSASGDGVHAHSVHFPIWGSNRNAATTIQAAAAVVPKIIESNYWLMGVSPLLYSSGLNAALSLVLLRVEKLATENPAGGWVDLLISNAVGVAENGCVITNGVCRTMFKRCPDDIDDSRMDIEGNRTWRFYGTSRQYGLGLWITWHSHTWTISGTVSGYVDVDGAGLTVNIYRCSDGMRIGTVTTTAGGAFTLTWYDNTEDYRAVCEEDGTHVGCSAKGVAT
jgi:hypothetical protein